MGSYYQLRYWHLLQETLDNINYLQEYLENSEKNDRRLNIAAALASSSSIATWAVWKEYPLFWSSIICTTQIYSSIKSYLPYQNRIKAITEALPIYRKLFLEIENNFFKVQEGMLTEEEINSQTIEARSKLAEMYNRFFSKISLPEKVNLLEKAHQKSKIYLKRMESHQ